MIGKQSRRRQIRFFPDYGHGPLWENGSENYTMEPSDYRLSASLSRDLIRRVRIEVADFADVVDETDWIFDGK